MSSVHAAADAGVDVADSSESMLDVQERAQTIRENIEELSRVTSKDAMRRILDVLSRITANALRSPEDPKFTRIKSNSHTFTTEVLPFPAAMRVLVVGGWRLQ